MEATNDGFRIAEEDLSIRGPGEFNGNEAIRTTRFRIGNIIRDGRILSERQGRCFFLVGGGSGVWKDLSIVS